MASTARLLKKLLRDPDALHSIVHELCYLLARNEEGRHYAYRKLGRAAPPKVPPSRRQTLLAQTPDETRDVSQ